MRHLYFEKDSYYVFRDNKLTPVLKDFSPWGAAIKNYPMYPNTTLHSVGGLYLAASMYVFSGFEDPGKLMGLAPYGRPGIYNFEIFELRDGRAFVRYDWMSQFDRPCRNYEEFKQNFQYYADIAYWIQREVERAVLYVFNSRYELAPSDCVAYAGGVALNAVANRRILTETKFEDVYIQPAAGDNGLAVGCAYYGWMEVLKRERVLHNRSMFLGKTYHESAIDEALAQYNSSLQYCADEDHIGKTAELLAEGKIVGWFQGGGEFGPRALGHRSILADPRKPEVRDFINARIKFREDFRPFAPSVLREDAGIFFDCDYESPFMILVAPVKPEWRDVIPSVTHKDQSARIQTVTQISSPKYYQLLCAFKKITGISVLLNTSFNRRGMPIVETPEQAIRFFIDCDLDVLVLDNYLIYKTAHAHENQVSSHITENFISKIRIALEDNMSAREMGGVYQINITGTRTLTIDLSREKPVIIEGEAPVNPLAVIELAESDLQTFLINPIVEGNRLFQAGKIKIEGSQNYALRLVSSLRII
jgi:carbamoyltransferase